MKDQDESKVDGIERRDHFRVMDVLPVIMRKLEAPVEPLRSRILRGFVPENEICPGQTEPGFQGQISPDIRRMLERIENKLNRILEKLQIPMEDTACIPEQPACLSAIGIRLKAPEGFNVNDIVEIKLRIKLQIPVWLLLYGHIARMVPGEEGSLDAAVSFFDLDEEIHESLIRYTLQKQREMIRKERGYVD